MIDRAFVFEDFKDRVGTVFTLSEEGVPPIPLTLETAELLPARFARPDTRPPFSLILICARPEILPQRIYDFDHADMGRLSLFVVPVGRDERGVLYQAVFN